MFSPSSYKVVTLTIGNLLRQLPMRKTEPEDTGEEEKNVLGQLGYVSFKWERTGSRKPRTRERCTGW